MKQLEIKTWYLITYPEDIMGAYLKWGVTFENLYNGMSFGKDYAAIVGESDSVVRERIFEKMAEIFSVSYEEIYEMWLNKKLGVAQ